MLRFQNPISNIVRVYLQSKKLTNFLKKKISSYFRKIKDKRVSLMLKKYNNKKFCKKI